MTSKHINLGISSGYWCKIRHIWHGSISALEREIDYLVYALYELTAEEIAIVEGRTA